MLKFFVAAQSLYYGLRTREEGQTMAEYGVVLAVLTIATVAIFTALSGGITDAVQRVIDLLGTAGAEE